MLMGIRRIRNTADASGQKMIEGFQVRGFCKNTANADNGYRGSFGLF
jgi:hypothetical protein